MTVLSVTTIGTSYQMPSLVGIVRAGGETDFVLKNDFIFMWLIVLPASLLAAFYFHAATDRFYLSESGSSSQMRSGSGETESLHLDKTHFHRQVIHT